MMKSVSGNAPAASDARLWPGDFFAIMTAERHLEDIAEIMKTCQNSNRTGQKSILLALALLASLPGCGRKDVASAPPVPAMASQSPAESVLRTWLQGDQAGAVKGFVETDWTARPLFGPESALSLSEKQLQALGESDRKARAGQFMPELDAFKKLARSVAEAGRDAAARNDTTYARKCFESLRQAGQALDSPESMTIVRLVGQALVKMADAEKAKVGI